MFTVSIITPKVEIEKTKEEDVITITDIEFPLQSKVFRYLTTYHITIKQNKHYALWVQTSNISKKNVKYHLLSKKFIIIYSDTKINLLKRILIKIESFLSNKED